MIVYTKLFKLLAERGYNTTKLKETGLIAQGTFNRIKNGVGGLDNRTIDRVCRELGVQPGDIMEYVQTSESKDVNQ